MGDLDTFEILVREHEQMLHGYLLAIVRDAERAEDLAQEAFVQAYKNLPSLKDKRSFAAWLRKIAKNLAINSMKKQAREVPTDPQFFQGIEDIFSSFDCMTMADAWEERVQAVKACLDKLPQKLHATCNMHYMEDIKPVDIAAKLSENIATIFKRLERGRIAVRECVEKHLSLEEI